jgi:hypothetical protein
VIEDEEGIFKQDYLHFDLLDHEIRARKIQNLNEQKLRKEHKSFTGVKLPVLKVETVK